MRRDIARTPTNLLLLHALRCTGHATLGRVAVATLLDEDQAEAGLFLLGAGGLVTRTGGAFGGWGLTDHGRTVDAEWIAAELDATSARTAVTTAYDNFLPLNEELLDLTTAWQLRTADGVRTVNEHDDAEYDTRVLDLFDHLDRRAADVCAPLSAALPRFARYRVRLAGALARARAGAVDLVATDTASYHAVWAELHEDLLSTLGIERW
jgi:hypothetical protein